jgi:NitT/TauT family transport system ATP-binding protein
MTAIDISQVTKIYSDPRSKRETVALDGISLKVEPNEFICLLGPSGCGKSTLLNMVAGFERPTQGVVAVNGKSVEEPGADRGVVFQQPTLMPWLTVWQNIAFHLKVKGLPKAQQREQAQIYIDRVGLTGFENHFPSELSGGMASRVGLARALLLNPAVILMDEPFAALDAQTKLDMQEELVALWQQDKGTVIFITHSVEEALVLGTRIVVMSARPGRIQEVIPVDMPYPRDITAPAFNDMKRHVLALFKQMHGKESA